VAALQGCGAQTSLVKTAADLSKVDGLVIPGGESTTIAKLARIFELFEDLRSSIRNGLPMFGTCAGLILLCDRVVDGIEGQETFGGLAATVQRNAFGHQTASFETELDFKGIEQKVAAAFIRAPIILETEPQVDVLSTLPDGTVVGVRQNNLLGISFHPEICGELAVHDYFVREVVSH
jgi:5'-phosphate synthase pdxT subunit